MNPITMTTTTKQITQRPSEWVATYDMLLELSCHPLQRAQHFSESEQRQLLIIFEDIIFQFPQPGNSKEAITVLLLAKDVDLIVRLILWFKGYLTSLHWLAELLPNEYLKKYAQVEHIERNLMLHAKEKTNVAQNDRVDDAY